MGDLLFTRVLTDAVDSGLVAAALVDRHGRTVALAGAISEEEAMPLAALVMYRLKSEDLGERLFAGEVISLALDDREVAVGVAKRQLFVVAVLPISTPTTQEIVRELRECVANMLEGTGDAIGIPPIGGSGGGSGSGPAELSLVELGLTVRRGRLPS